MTSNDTLVSIIVPVYGTEAYLPACIESICNQTYTNIQIVLVDDQSPDGCPVICDQYAQKDPRILVMHQENKGVSGARNSGLHRATGDYIMFVDSDDELYPNAVEILMWDAYTYEADIVGAIQRQNGGKRNSARDYEYETYTFFQKEDSLRLSLGGANNMDAVWGKLFKAAFIEDIFFEEGQNINEDGFFLFQCCLKKPVLVQHNVAVYQYNTRHGSASRQVFSDKYLSMLYFCERKKELITAHYPQYMEHAYNMEVRTNLQFLEVLCRTSEKKYKKLQRKCVSTVRQLYKHHKPISEHHKLLAWIVKCGLYPIYKWAVRLKYYR